MTRSPSVDRVGMHPGLGALIQQIGSGTPRAYLARLATQSPINGSVTIAVVLLITPFLLAQGYSIGVLAWAAAQLAVAGLMVVRWWMSPQRHQQASPLDSTPSRRGLYHALLWAGLTGGLWGALTAFIPGAPPHVQMVLILTMGGMAAGASATLAAVPQVAALFILGCTAPATLYFFTAGGEVGVTLALVFTVFTAAMIAMSQVVFSALTKEFDAEWHVQELEAVGAALREAEAALREADQAKDEFLAVLGHELRNPLAPLRTGLDILKQAPRHHDQLDDLLPILDRQLSHLVRLVDDLLDISRISRGAIELRSAPLALSVPIRAAVEQTRSLIDQRRHCLIVSEPDEPLSVEADVERLTQVFANLLDNAAKYMQPGGTIRVTSAAERGHALVRIRDEGYGIPPEDRERVFTLFSRIPEHGNGVAGGLGIGLALSRRLIEMQGGSIEAQSEGLGHGSEFVVRLPLAGDQDRAPDRNPLVVDAIPPRRVLVVDDNVDAAEGLRMLLEMHGHCVDTAFDGHAALRAIERVRPDLVLLDLGMPGIDGVEVARRARSQPGGAGLILVAVTGWSQDEDRQRTRAAGFDGHLIKPIRWDELAELLGRAARRHDPIPLD